MTFNKHRIYVGVLALIVVIALAAMIRMGSGYYTIPVPDRSLHPEHDILKPGGTFGHGYGVVGSLLIITGVGSYMIRKRSRMMARMGLLKNWLIFHIFLCTLGPFVIVFHTAFKFGGLVAVSFWSMVIVFLSGIAGRFIYLQIPRSIEGNSLSKSEIIRLKKDPVFLEGISMDAERRKLIEDSLAERPAVHYGNPLTGIISIYREDHKNLSRVKQLLKSAGIRGSNKSRIISFIKQEYSLNRKIELLDTMENLFSYWHVAHLPFAMVMLVIMLIHVAVTVIFGYRWIF